jgi:Membrane protein putatively involved in post-translational modification of the autoinducing quorum-sensing peptide
MFRIEKLCNKISNNIAKELNLDDDKKSIINYGLFAFVQTGICIALVLIVGFIFNVIIESLIISFTISILRKSSGGAHARSAEACAIIGTILSVGLGILAKHLNISISFILLMGSVIFIWSYYIIYKFAPVDSIEKPIININKIKKLKRISLIIISIYLVIVLLNISYFFLTLNAITLEYVLCIYLGILWQVFSLTKYGHFILKKLF